VVLARVACTVVVPKGAIALQDLFLSADRRTTETYAACLAELARTGAVCASCLYTWVPADHAALQSAVEASGYRYIGSCFRATTLGRARSWQTLESLEVLSHRPSDG